MHFTSVLQKQFAVNDMFLKEANSYNRALALRNSRLVSPSAAACTIMLINETRQIFNLLLMDVHIGQALCPDTHTVLNNKKSL